MNQFNIVKMKIEDIAAVFCQVKHLQLSRRFERRKFVLCNFP